MIDNVILLLTGTLHERDTRELLDKCHPLGLSFLFFSLFLSVFDRQVQFVHTD